MLIKRKGCEGMEDNNQDFIVGCVFEYIGSKEGKYHRSDIFEEVWAKEDQTVLDSLFETLEEKAKDSKYHTYFALDYGYSIVVKIVFPEPIDTRYDDIDIDDIKDKVINYYKDELDIDLEVYKDLGYILRKDLEHWTVR